jgi:hypothetical protein
MVCTLWPVILLAVLLLAPASVASMLSLPDLWRWQGEGIVEWGAADAPHGSGVRVKGSEGSAAAKSSAMAASQWWQTSCPLGIAAAQSMIRQESSPSHYAQCVCGIITPHRCVPSAWGQRGSLSLTPGSASGASPLPISAREGQEWRCCHRRRGEPEPPPTPRSLLLGLVRCFHPELAGDFLRIQGGGRPRAWRIFVLKQAQATRA